MQASFWSELGTAWTLVGSIATVVAVIGMVARLREDRRFRSIAWWQWAAFAVGSALIAVGLTGLWRAAVVVLAAGMLVACLVRVGITVSENWHLGASAHYMNEKGNAWALMLDRRGGGAAGVECIVTDPLGGKTRKSFGQADQVIHVSYPDAFDCACYATSKQPWGRYRVEWNVLRSTGRPGKMRREGRAKVFFDWQPFVRVGAQFGRRRFLA